MFVVLSSVFDWAHAGCLPFLYLVLIGSIVGKFFSKVHPFDQFWMPLLIMNFVGGAWKDGSIRALFAIFECWHCHNFFPPLAVGAFCEGPFIANFRSFFVFMPNSGTFQWVIVRALKGSLNGTWAKSSNFEIYWNLFFV